MRFAGLLVFVSSAAWAQSAAPAFEVASVKLWATREIGGVHPYAGGRIEFRGCTLQYLIQQAFDLQPFQVSGGPGWMLSERYDIDAKAPASSKSSSVIPASSKSALTDEQRQMLQSLLTERFQLKVRQETKEGPVYLLVRGNKPLKMTDSKDKGAYPWAGGPSGGMIMGDGLAGINEPMDDLAKRLSPYMGRPVLDRTGISGSFDFQTEYSSTEARPDVVTMILVTVQDIGLKLESSKGPVEALVVERLEKPSEN
jgi:uncharacterized protein (TIGR03435 family)